MPSFGCWGCLVGLVDYRYKLTASLEGQLCFQTFGLVSLEIKVLMGPSWCVQREVVCGNISCNNIMQFKAVKLQMQLQSLEGSASDWRLKEKLRSGTKMQWLELCSSEKQGPLMSATVVDKSVDILCGMQICYHGSCSF